MAYLMQGFEWANPVQSFAGGLKLGDAIRTSQYKRQLRQAIDQDQSLSEQDRAFLRMNPEDYGTFTQNKQRLAVGSVSADRLKLREAAAAAVPIANDAARRYRAAAIELKAAMNSGDAAAIEASKSALESAMQEYNGAITTVANVEGMSSYVTGKLDSAEEIAADKALRDANLTLKELSAKYKPEEIAIEKQKAQAALTTANASAGLKQTEASQQQFEIVDGVKKSWEGTDDGANYSTSRTALEILESAVANARNGNPSAMQTVLVMANKADDPRSAVLLGEATARGEQSVFAEAARKALSVLGEDERSRLFEDAYKQAKASFGTRVSVGKASLDQAIQLANERLEAAKLPYKATEKDFFVRPSISFVSGGEKPKAKPSSGDVKEGTRKVNSQGATVEFVGGRWKVVQ